MVMLFGITAMLFAICGTYINHKRIIFTKFAMLFASLARSVWLVEYSCHLGIYSWGQQGAAGGNYFSFG